LTRAVFNDKSDRSTGNRYDTPWYRSWFLYASVWFGGGVTLFASGEWLWGLALFAIGIVTTYLSLRPPIPRDVRELLRRAEEEAAAEDLEASKQYPEAVRVLDEFDKVIHRAPPVPLTSQVRLDRGKIAVLLDRLRTGLNHGPSELTRVLDELDELVRTAKPIPLTNQIRVERSEIYNLLDRLRAGCATPTAAEP
jgi:hypothetical protein